MIPDSRETPVQISLAFKLFKESSDPMIPGKCRDPISPGKLNGNAYKRSQTAPGLNVTHKAFGIGRRRPIAGRFYMAFFLRRHGPADLLTLLVKIESGPDADGAQH